MHRDSLGRVNNLLSSDLLSKLEQTSKQIGSWGYNTFKKRAVQIKEKELVLANLQQNGVDSELSRAIMELKD